MVCDALSVRICRRLWRLACSPGTERNASQTGSGKNPPEECSVHLLFSPLEVGSPLAAKVGAAAKTQSAARMGPR